MTNFLLEFKTYLFSLRKSIFSFFAEPSGLQIFPLKQKLQAFLLITLVAFAVYLNTLGHQMAYDDVAVIKQNDFVLKGVKGIPDILTHDSYYCYLKNNNLGNFLPEGRYRPLSIISFALEQQLVGTKHDSVPLQFIWDLNGNGIVDPDEDVIPDNKLTPDDFFARGLGLMHFTNIFLFAISLGLVYVFFTKYISFISADVIFAACLIFAVHPIHTEVVANIKSRDELLSFLFIFLSLIFVFKFFNSSKTVDLFMFSFSYLLALLSKEYALLLPVIIFFILYLLKNQFIKTYFDIKKIASLSLLVITIIGMYFIKATNLVFLIMLIYASVISVGYKFGKLDKFISFMGLPIIIYLALRFNATTQQLIDDNMFSQSIISNPFALATPEQTMATKVFILLKYLLLLIVPNPLIFDYSYSTIPYVNFADLKVIFSIVVFLFFITLFFISVFKRKPFSLILLLFFIFFLPISNFIVEIGATMGERLIFHASLGFCFLIVWPIQFIYNFKIEHKTVYGRTIMLLITFFVLFFASLTFQRNKDWENNNTLIAADYPKAKRNIVLIAGQARLKYEKAEQTKNINEKNKLLNESIQLIDEGLQLNGAYLLFYHTLALDFYLLKQYDNASSSAKAGLKIDSTDFTLKMTLTAISKEFIIQGITEYKKGNNENAILLFDKAIKSDNKNVDAFYNKAIILKQQGDTINAIDCLNKAIKIDPKKQFKERLQELKKI